MADNLTPKQEKFCLEYIETGNASEAYRRSYDAENMKPESVNRKAKELMDNVKITARLERARQAVAEKAEISRAWVLERLVANADRAMQYEGNRDGDTYQGSVANKALELVGKEIGMFVDRKELGKPGEFANLDDASLDKAIRDEAERLGFVFTPDSGETSKTQH